MHMPSLDTLRQRRSAKWRFYPEDVLPAWVAEMDFEVAPPIAAELEAAIRRSDLGYRDTTGLGEAFAGFAAHSWQWEVEPRRVTAVADVVTGIAESLKHLTEPGSSVVINTPVYPPFFSSVRDVARRELAEVPLLREPDGTYRWDLEGMEAAFARPEVSAYLMCHPHNPTGSVATLAELQAIADLARVHDVVVVADEIHGPLTLPGAVHVPYLKVAGDDARAVVITSASKSWNIPGLKCAQIIASSTTSPVIARMPMEVTFGAGHLGVIAAIAAFTDGQPWLNEVAAVLDANRNDLVDLVAGHLPGVSYAPPAASYLAWLDFAAAGLGDNPAAVLLEHGRVALSPGPNYGPGGTGFARLNFATSPEILRAIIERVALGLDAARP